MPKSLCVFVATLCLAGCTASEPAADPNDRAAIAAATDIASDSDKGHHEPAESEVLEYSLSRTVQKCSGQVCSKSSRDRKLRAWLEDLPSGEAGGQLYLTAYFDQDSAFQYSASSGGSSLPVAVIERDAAPCEGAGCTLVETVVVTFTPEELRVAAAQGLAIKLSDSRSGMGFKVPAAYFVRFLETQESRDIP